MKNLIFASIVLLATFISGGCGNVLDAQSGPEVGGPLPPATVAFTYVPSKGSFQYLKGTTDGVNHVTYRVVVFIKVDGVWWVKPYYARPLTPIQWDGTWTCDITTGGHDQDATEIRAYVVSSDYDASLDSLPVESDYIAWIGVVRGELLAQAEADETTINQGQSTTLRGSATGGIPPYTYTWSAPGWSGSTEQNATVTPSETTAYTLEVSDSSSPVQTDADTVMITVTVCQPDLSFLQGIVDGTVKAINFAPANFDPTVGDFPTEQQIKANLLQLYEDGFRGILTYDVDGTPASIPRIAKEIGFQVVGVGIWDINDQGQIDTAVGLAEYADFYIVGSEGIFASRYTKQQLAERIEDVRSAKCKPVTTSEPWDVLLANTDILDMIDFVAVNIYGWWEGAHEAQDAVDVLIEHFDDVQDAAGAKIVLVRETGFPTGGHPDASVCKQQQYFQLLEQSTVPFAYFEAYDQFWKHEMHEGYDIGPHWGVYDRYGNRKECDEINNPPVADQQSLSTSFQTPVDITLTAADPDGDDLTYTIESQPSNGTLAGTPPAVTYTPNAGFSGQDGFTFKATDGQFDSNLATVTITVAEPLPATIQFTYVPPIGSFENLEGSTDGVDYVAYRVVVYIKVDGTWWVKPYLNHPLITIRSDGTWTCDITTGGHDQDATEIRAFVVNADYDADLHSLPQEQDYTAWSTVLR